MNILNTIITQTHLSSSRLFLIPRNKRQFHFTRLSSMDNKDVNKIYKEKIGELANEEPLNLLKGLDEILKNSDPMTVSEQLKETLSTFEEAFPNFQEVFKEKELTGSFKSIKEISDRLENSEILTKILEEKGLVSMLKLFNNNNPDFNPKETLEVLKQGVEEKIKLNMDNKPLGDFGEITLNEVYNQGTKFIKPLSEALAKGGLDISAGAQIVTFLFMFNSICKSHSTLIRSHLPYKEYYHKLPLFEKLHLENLWIKNNLAFKIYAAPLLVTSLYVIKNVALAPTISLSINSNTETEIPNKSISLLAFFKKLPNIVGKIVILIILQNIIKYFLNLYSINIMDPFYIKLFCGLNIIITSVLCLDNLLKLFVYRYFIKNKKLSVPNKLPKLIYDYLNTLKILSKIEHSSVKYFLINFSIYFIILLLLIIILFII